MTRFRVAAVAALLLLAAAPRGSGAAGCPPGDFGGCRAQCDEGDAGSCERLAAIYRVGTIGVARDEARAVELYRKACTLGSTNGCDRLREMYREGRGFDRPAHTKHAP